MNNNTTTKLLLFCGIFFLFALMPNLMFGQTPYSEQQKNKPINTKQTPDKNRVDNATVKNELQKVVELSDEENWTKKEQANFMEACKKNNKKGFTEDGVKTYCDCILGELMKKYKNTKDTINITPTEKTEMGKDCMTY